MTLDQSVWRSLSLEKTRASTRNPFMPHHAYGAGGFYGQFADLGEKHRERKPSTETRRGRSDLDVSTYDGTRGADRVGMAEGRGRSRALARDGRLVLRQFQELLRRESPSRFRSLRRPARLRELVRLVLWPAQPGGHGDDPSREIRGDVRRREGSRGQGVREDAEESRGGNRRRHPGAGQDLRLQLPEVEGDGRGGHRRESGAAPRPPPPPPPPRFPTPPWPPGPRPPGPAGSSQRPTR